MRVALTTPSPSLAKSRKSQSEGGELPALRLKWGFVVQEVSIDGVCKVILQLFAAAMDHRPWTMDQVSFVVQEVSISKGLRKAGLWKCRSLIYRWL